MNYTGEFKDDYSYHGQGALTHPKAASTPASGRIA